MPTIQFRLATPLPLWNDLLRHGSRLPMRQRRGMYRRTISKLAKDVWGAIVAEGQRLPSVPFSEATVQVIRRSVGLPDPDGLSVKPLLDVLQPFSLRHPYGLGIIANDSQQCLRGGATIIAEHVGKRADQCTLVIINGAHSHAVPADGAIAAHP